MGKADRIRASDELEQVRCGLIEPLRVAHQSGDTKVIVVLGGVMQSVHRAQRELLKGIKG